jgi:hypothetical protein
LTNASALQSRAKQQKEKEQQLSQGNFSARSFMAFLDSNGLQKEKLDKEATKESFDLFSEVDSRFSFRFSFRNEWLSFLLL